MSKFFFPLAAACAVLPLACQGADRAGTPTPVTYVSGKGIDTGTCAAPASPCRSFQFAINQTSAGGEVKALDPADYGRIVIKYSVSITGVEGAGIFGGSGGNAIVINAGPNDIVNFRHLILDGGNKSTPNGILLNSAGSVTITHCTVRNFVHGLFAAPTSATRFLITDVVVSDNSDFGIAFLPTLSGSAKGILDHALVSNNGNIGIAAAGSVLRLAHSVATGNGIGVDILAGGIVDSSGDNFINGNGTDINGTLVNVGTH